MPRLSPYVIVLTPEERSVSKRGPAAIRYRIAMWCAPRSCCSPPRDSKTRRSASVSICLAPW